MSQFPQPPLYLHYGVWVRCHYPSLFTMILLNSCYSSHARFTCVVPVGVQVCGLLSEHMEKRKNFHVLSSYESATFLATGVPLSYKLGHLDHGYFYQLWVSLSPFLQSKMCVVHPKVPVLMITLQGQNPRLQQMTTTITLLELKFLTNS